MAIAWHNAVDTSFTGSVSSHTRSYTTTSGADYLVVRVVIVDNTGTITGVTFNSVAMFLIGNASRTGAAGMSYMFGLRAPSIGTFNVVVTASEVLDTIGLVIHSASGVEQSSNAASFRTVATDMQDATATSPSLNATSVAGDLVVDVLTNFGDLTITVGADQTQEFNSSMGGGSALMLASYEVATGTTTTMSWTASGSLYYSHVAVALVPAAAAGIALNAHDGQDTAGVASITITNFTAATGSVIVVGTATGNNTGIASVTYNSQALTEQYEQNLAGAGITCRVGVFIGVAGADGSPHSVVVTWDSNPGAVSQGVHVSSWTGVANSTVAATHRTIYAAGDSVGTMADVTVIDSQAGDAVVSTNYASATAIATAQTSIQEDDNIAGDGKSFGTSYTMASGASTVMSWTGGNFNTHVAFALVPAAEVEAVTLFRNTFCTMMP